MAKTPAQLGMVTPSGTDLIRNGDNAITKNAQVTADWIGRLLNGEVELIELTGGEDLNDFRTPGRYILRSASTASPILNIPPWITAQNVFYLRVIAHTIGAFEYVMQDFSGLSDGSAGVSSGYYRRNTSGASGELWIPWRRLDNDVAVANGGAGNANRLRVQEFKDAFGTISTGGKAAVALRFDHGLANFNTKIRPLLEARDLPYCLALSSRHWDASENSGVTPAMVDSWPLAEVWNHGAGNHQDANDLAGLTDMIVTGKSELQAQLPNKTIWGFIPPGVGGTNYGGFNGGDSPEAFYGTLAGQLILENHAVSSGAFPGTAYRPLDGEVRQGMSHAGLETRTVSSLQSLVNTAIADKTGLQLMTHPSRLDEAGYHTTADLTQMLDYIVAKRDAGELVVLSPYEMLVAQLKDATYGTELGTQNLDGVTQIGAAYQPNNANATAERGYPVPGMGGTLINLPLIPSIQRMTQLFILNHGVGTAMYVRSLTGTGWTDWSTYMTQSSSDNRYYRKTVLDPILNGIPSDSAEHSYRLSALRGRRGPVSVKSRGVVVLAFDHGLTKYKSIVHPMLEARSLPVTLAVNSQLLNDPTNSDATQADLSAWAAGPLVEIANHGRTHTYPSNLEFEIRGGREELEAITGQPIDTYVQAGITGDTWGGTYEDVAGSKRGKSAFESHAIIAGVMPTPNMLYPIDGIPTLGVRGSWIDNGGAAVTTAKNKITEAVNAGKMTIIRLHPEHIDGIGRITTAELAGLLDWIVTERSAGHIEVLQLRDASIATREFDPRDTGIQDITSQASGGSISSGTVTFQHKNGWNVLSFSNVAINGTGSVTLYGNNHPFLKLWAPGVDGATSGSVTEALTLGSSGADYRRVSLNHTGGLIAYGVTAGNIINGAMVWPMNRTMP